MHGKLPSMQGVKCICTYVGVPLTKQMGLVAGHPDLAHGRTLLGVALAPSLSESTAAFLFPTGRPDFLKWRKFYLSLSHDVFVCLIWIFTSHLQSSWVKPVLSYDKCALLKDNNAVTPVRLKPAALRSWVKHSTTEPLRSLYHMMWYITPCNKIDKPLVVYRFGNFT